MLMAGMTASVTLLFLGVRIGYFQIHSGVEQGSEGSINHTKPSSKAGEVNRGVRVRDRFRAGRNPLVDVAADP